MKVCLKTLIVAVSCLAFTSAFAATNNNGSSTAQPDASLEQLLSQVEAAQTRASEINQKREQRFLQARNQQRELLQQAKAEHARVEARSDKLQDIFNKNEEKLNKLATQLRNREGNLGEVFGVVRQTAANLKGVIDSSIVSAQIEGRGDFLSRMANASSLPSIEDLHKLWYMMMQQAAAEGQVVRFPAKVVQPDGTQKEVPVVRVGSFVAVHGSNYLHYLPETGQLVVYANQPGMKNAQSRAANLYNSSRGDGSGNIPMAIDPSGGQLLSLLTRSTKSFMERLNDGGKVGYTIVVLFIIGILVAIERIIALTIASRKVKRQLNTNEPSADNALGRVLMTYQENSKDDTETLELKLDEAIMKEQPALEARAGVLSIIAAVGPLLGLLGTVIGMIITFQTITTFGSADPSLMAGGIARALVTTVEGLVTAIPLVLLHAYITSRSGNIVQILEEQSAGIIAAQAEKKS